MTTFRLVCRYIAMLVITAVITYGISWLLF
jgi:hypothetical protein